MRKPTARTWEILDLARAAAERHGIAIEVLLALVIETIETGDDGAQADPAPPERDPTGW